MAESKQSSDKADEKSDKADIKKEKELAKKLSEPLESSAVRSQKKGNTHPVKPEDREDTLSGNTATTDELAALEGQKNAIEQRIKTVEETKDRLENTELYKRDLLVKNMAKAGELPGQNIGKAAIAQEEPRAKAERERLEKFEEELKKDDKK